VDKWIDDILRLGTRCNFNCPFCNVLNHEEIKDRTFDELKAMIDSLPRDVRALSLSGGEPTLYADLGRVVEYAVGRGWNVILQTNAALVTPEMARSLKEAGVGSAFVNFPSHEPDVYAELTGTEPSVFGAAVRGMHNLIGAGIPVQPNIVINELNYRGLEDYVRFINKEFPSVSVVCFSAIQPHGNAWLNPHLVPDYRELGDYIGAAAGAAGELGIAVLNPFCGVPVCVTYGRMSMQNNLDMVSGWAIRKEGRFPEPVSRVVGSKMQPDSCRECYLRNYCMGVWKKYYEIRGDVVEPPFRSLRAWPNC
jgi:MoaA/NifB/PqqE/SkfB family radical SAM enzyme